MRVFLARQLRRLADFVEPDYYTISIGPGGSTVTGYHNIVVSSTVTRRIYGKPTS